MPRSGHARDHYYEDDTYVYERDRDRDRDRYTNGSRRDRVFKEQVEIEADERDDVEFYRRGRKFSGGTPGQEVERVRVRERDRERDRSAPDFVRESFAPRKESGQLVLSRGRDRDRDRERDEIDVSMSGALVGPGRRGGGRKEMEMDVDVDVGVDRARREDRDVYLHSGESRGWRIPRREVERDEIIIREKDVEREEMRRSPPVDREEIIIKEKRDVNERRRPARRDIERDEIVVKKRDRSLPVRRSGYEEAEEVMVRRDRRDETPRRRPSFDREREEFTFRFEEVDGAPRRRYEVEQDDVRYASKPRQRPSSPRRRSREKEEEIVIRTSERDRGRRKGDVEREDEEIIVQEKQWNRGRWRGDVERDEEIIIREKGRDRGRRRADVQAEEEEIIIRHGERERGRRKADTERNEEDILIRMRERDERQRKNDINMEEEEIIIRQSERDRQRREKRREKDEEIIIRHREERSPSPGPPPLREPPVIRAPPIHQEVITHHRHIDHGFEPVRAPSPEPMSPRSSFEELEFRHRETRGRSTHEDDIVIERRGKHDSPSPVRRRSPKRYEQIKSDEVMISRSGRPRSLDREQEIVIGERDRRNTLDSRDELDIREEADFYERRNAERASIGEAYHGVTKDWAIVDVPPGTKRVTMEGVGGASEEVSWQRYNGVRRSRFLPNGDASSFSDEEESSFNNNGVGQIGRRYHGVKDKRDRLWTEITKDLVIKEALDRAGYEYEETEYFYYVFTYLRYDDISTLVDLSDEIRRARRERIHEIHRERVSLPSPLALPPPPAKIPTQQPWNRIEYKEEVVIDEGRRPSRRW